MYVNTAPGEELLLREKDSISEFLGAAAELEIGGSKPLEGVRLVKRCSSQREKCCWPPRHNCSYTARTITRPQTTPAIHNNIIYLPLRGYGHILSDPRSISFRRCCCPTKEATVDADKIVAFF
jgi:hypothetical protein